MAAPPDTDSPTLPGGTSAPDFLARYWQRRPRLLRDVIAGFTGPLDRAALFALAARDDVESRVVLREGRGYVLEHGPFPLRRWRRMPPRNWTLLVQGVNVVDRACDALLRRFAFVPYARLDDLMVSYAVPGGGVGPHFDSYDVFLLQGFGRRRWRYGAQRDLRLRERLPVKILRHFTPSRDEVLAPGDMLYLPPQQAHDGIAIDECTTYSIGFRAPAHQEIAVAFLDHLRDTIDVPGRYTDPGLAATARPGRLDPAMVERLAAPLARVRWSQDDLAAFLGGYLTEPKPQVAFEPPDPAPGLAAFARAARVQGVHLDLRTQLLYDAQRIYCNGEAAVVARALRPLIERLADRRALDAADIARGGPALTRLLHDWHSNGYIGLGT